MKPLVLWCRWHEATLRLRGRSDEAVWGELVYQDGGESELFRFDLQSWQLVRGEDEGETTVVLDEMGVEIE